MVSCIMCGMSHTARKVGITFHRFPKDPELRSAWIKFVQCSVKNIPKSVYLCSQHFQKWDFEKSAFKVILKRGVVPSILVKRHKYERIGKIKEACLENYTEALLSDVPNTSTDPEKTGTREIIGEIKEECLENYTGALPSLIPNISTDPEKTTTQHISNDNMQRKIELQHQIQKLYILNVRKSQQIKKLQKETWVQNKLILKLTPVIEELQNKHLINADQVNNCLDECRENKKIICRSFNQKRCVKTSREICPESYTGIIPSDEPSTNDDSMDIINELQFSSEETTSQDSVIDNTLQKLQQQIRELSVLHTRKYQQIRHLQKKAWSQKLRISKLSSVVRELQDKNIKTDQMGKCWAPGCKHYSVRETCKFFAFPKAPKEYERWIKLLRYSFEI